MSNTNALAIKGKVEGMIADVAKVLPRHMSADRMARVFLTCIRKNPKLARCTPQSFATALLQASEVGLEPNGRDAYLIPYGTECQFQADYKGILKLARNSGQIVSAEARAVYENDEFEYEYGLESKLRHVPAARDPGEFRGAYAIIRTKDDGVYWQYMEKPEIERYKKHSKGAHKNDSPWKQHYDAMAKKTVLRQVMKLAPSSTDIEKAVDWDERNDMGHAASISEEDLKMAEIEIEDEEAESRFVMDDPAEGQEPSGEFMQPGQDDDFDEEGLPRKGTERKHALMDAIEQFSEEPDFDTILKACGVIQIKKASADNLYRAWKELKER